MRDGAPKRHYLPNTQQRATGLRAMEIFNYLVPLAVAAVAVVLLLGLWNMLRGGSASRSQNLMRWRVILQFAAILLIMAALWLANR
jgi:hypothetical protein